MRKNVRLGLVATLVILGGCSTTIVNKEGTIPQKIYTSANAQCIPTDENTHFVQEKINSILKKDEIYGEDLLIDCEVQAYDEGSRALRYLIGFGVGSATSEAKIIFKDKEKKVSEFNVKSVMGMGIFGGNSKNVLENIAKKTVDYAKEYLIKDKNE